MNIMPSKKHLLVVCAIIENNGKILAAKRASSQPHPGQWEFPGGKMAAGEDPDAAIAREIREEFGCDIAVKDELPDASFSYPEKNVTLIPLVCRVESGEAAALEHEEIRWVDRKEAEQLDWLPPDREIMKDYFRMREEEKK